MPPMTAQAKAAEIKKLRESGMSDAQIIAKNPKFVQGFAVLVKEEENRPKADAGSSPRGSGAGPDLRESHGSYGDSIRPAQLG